MTIRFLAPAQAELDEAIEWYAKQAPGLGDAFLLETLKTIQLVERHPQAGHSLSDNTRRCRLSRFPYGVIYAIDRGDMLVVAIAHSHRRPGYWRQRLTPPG